MVARTVIDTASEYARVISRRFPVRRVFLYGSYARGTPTQYSDIDIAVVMEKMPENIPEAEAVLFRLGMDIDVRIEPVIVDEENDYSGFYEEISRYGTLIYGTI